MKKRMTKLTCITLILTLLIVVPGTNLVCAQSTVDKSISVLSGGALKILPMSKTICGILPKTDVRTVLSVLQGNGTLSVKDTSGATVTSGNMGTGYQVVLQKGNIINDRLTAVIYGDVNSDSSIDVIDLLEQKKSLLNIKPLTDTALAAADVNKDEEFNAIDLLGTKRYVLKIGSIYNNAHFYVSKTGLDTNSGSQSAPFLTIQKAANTMTAGDTCFIMGGEYTEAITVKNAGQPGAPITFKPFNNEKVTVSGLEKITTPWTLYSGNIYQTNVTLSMNEFNQVFADREMQTLARYPNKGTDQVISVGQTLSASAGGDTSVTSTAITQPEGYFNGASISTEGSSHYIHYTSVVTSQTVGKAVFTKIGSGWDSPTSGSKFYFYNKLNLLDTENEWYYNEGTLYLYAKNGVNPNTMNIEYKSRINAFDVSGKAYITIEGLNLFGATVKTDKSSTRLILDSNTIEYYYHTSKSYWYPWEAAFQRVIIKGAFSIIKNNTVAYGAEAGIQIEADHCSVVNNYLHDLGYINSNAGAITPMFCNYTLIAYNTVENTARTGIILNGTNLRVTHNRLRNISVNMNDSSVIGSYKFDAMGLTEVDHNIISDSNNNKDVIALYLDNGSLNFLVHHNLAYNMDRTMHLNCPSYNNKVYNNTLIGINSVGTGNLDNIYNNNAKIGADWTGDQFFNNIMPPLFYGDHAFMGNNLYNQNSGLKFTNPGGNDYTLQADSVAVDKGIPLSVGTDEYEGTAPDIGAFEYGKLKWEAGHDFSKERDTTFSLTEQVSGFMPYWGLPFLEAAGVTGTNLLQNGSFESGLTGWDTNSTTAVKVDAKYPVDGNNSLHLTSAGGGWANQIINGVVPGQTYYFSGNVKSNSYENACEFGVHFMNNSDAIVGQSAFYVTDNEYAHKASFFTVPPGTTKLRIFAACWTTSHDIYIDDVKLIRVNP